MKTPTGPTATARSTTKPRASGVGGVLVVCTRNHRAGAGLAARGGGAQAARRTVRAGTLVHGDAARAAACVRADQPQLRAPDRRPRRARATGGRGASRRRGAGFRRSARRCLCQRRAVCRALLALRHADRARRTCPRSATWTSSTSRSQTRRGKVTGIFVEGTDVTERTLAEQALRDSEARLRTINADLERQVAERIHGRGRTWQLTTDLLGILNDATAFSKPPIPAWQTVLGWPRKPSPAPRSSIFCILTTWRRNRRAFDALAWTGRAGAEPGKPLPARRRQLPLAVLGGHPRG